MSRLKHARRLAALLALVGLSVAAVALADTVTVNDVVTGGDATKNVGETGTVKFVMTNTNGDGGANGCNTAGANPVTFNVTSSQSTKVSLDSSTITFPGCDEANAQTVGYTAVAEGSSVISVSYASGGKTGTQTASAYGTSDTMTVTVTSPNAAPTVPGTPTLDSLSSTPNQGIFGLTWAASTDPDEDSVTYQLQHQDADDSAYSDVTGATALTSNSFSFTESAAEAEGTWTYKVRASDGALQSAYSGASSQIKVDKTGPSAPTAAFDRSPEDASGNWFKDTVTVSYSGSTDGALLDGSAGSGVASHGTSQTFSTSNTHSYSGTATDNAGNSSAATTGSVKVDATNPSVSLSGCPTGPVIAGSTQSVTVSASDAHSGLASDSVQNGASVTLDTSSIGPAMASVTAKDKVGHTTTSAPCNYSVAYGFVGFLAPINGDAVNSGKTGRTYPIKWRLNRDDGTGNLVPISDADALALVGQMSAGQSSVSCGSLIGPSDALEEATTGSTALRYDSVDDQFIYNYKAPSTAGCYVFGIRKHDGATTKQVQFNFTR
jgi:hypothetical protein